VKFVKEQYEYNNTVLKNSVTTILHKLDEIIADNLEGFYDEIFISDCLYWNVTLNADITVSDIGCEGLHVKEMLKRYGEFLVSYKNVKLFRMKIELKGDNTLTLKNKFEILFNFQEVMCKECKKLRSECGCIQTNEQVSDDLKTIISLGPNLFDKLDESLTVKLDKEDKVSEAKNRLSDSEISSVVMGLQRRLGIAKTKIQEVAKKILKVKPDIDFDGLVSEIIRKV